jgi:hypothetical protein
MFLFLLLLYTVIGLLALKEAKIAIPLFIPLLVSIRRWHAFP